MNREFLHVDEEGKKYVFDPSSEAGDPVEKCPVTEKKEDNQTELEEERNEPQESGNVLFKDGEVVK